MENELKIEMGSHQTLLVQKMFGPAIFADLRVTPDPERGWVIERKRNDSGKWYEMCVLPAQYEDEFEGI